MFNKLVTSLRTQVITGLAIGTTILIVSVLLFFVSRMNADIENTISDIEQSIEMSYNARINSQAKLLSIPIEVLLSDEHLLQTFANRDRETLKKMLLPTYENSLKPKYGIKQFQFHLPDATSFLRLHKPEKYGDNLSSFRKTVVEVNKTHKAIRGIEVGKYGPGIRIVYPVEYKGKHLGSVEFGGSIFGMLSSMKKEYSFEYAIGMEKEVIENAGFKSSNDTFESNNIIYLKASSPNFKKIVSQYKFNREPQEIQFDDKYLSIFEIPLKDYAGKVVGYLAITKDITSQKESMIASMKNIAFLFIGIALFFFISSLIYLTKQIANPLKQGVDFAEQIRAGNFNVHLKQVSKTEIGQLTAALKTTYKICSVKLKRNRKKLKRLPIKQKRHIEKLTKSESIYLNQQRRCLS